MSETDMAGMILKLAIGERDVARAQRDAYLAALEWYAEKATAMNRYMEAKPPDTNAMVALATELCLDNGKRYQAAITIHSSKV